MAKTSEDPIALHPLRARRKPGPKGAGEPLQVEIDLENASKVLELVEAGELDKGLPLAPLSIAVDAIGDADVVVIVGKDAAASP